MPNETKRDYEFGSYRIDARERFLYCDGQPVSLPPKVFDTLLVLVENSGRIVEKAALMEQVWPDVAVEENNLTQNVSMLRKTLGDSGDGRKFIETVPRRGYRFIALVTTTLPRVEEPVPQALDDGVTPAPLSGVHRSRRSRLFAIAGLSLALLSGVVLLLRYTIPAPVAPILRQLTTNSAELPLSAGAISPDGKYFAYTDPVGLHIKLLTTGETHLLSAPPGLAILSLCWFPDSTRLLASGSARLQSNSGIWLVSLLGEPPRKLWNEPGQVAVSRDGSQIALVTANFEEIWLMQANGLGAQRIHQTTKPGENVVGVQWAPAGGRLAYARVHTGPKDPSGKGPRLIDLESIDQQGNNLVRLPFDPAITGGSVLPDGRFVYSLHRASMDWGETAFWERTTDSGFTKLLGKAQLLTKLSGGVSPFGFSATADGRQIVFLKGEPQWDVCVGELDQGGKHLGTPTRLTLDDHNDMVSGWSLDSRAVLFASDRNGNFDIFKQFIDQQIAQPIVANPPDEMGGVATPDGSSYYYLVMPDGWKSTQYRALRWMQVPVTGGPSRPVFDAAVPGEIFCSLPPSNVCVLPEHDGNDMVVYAVDPVKGKGREMARDSLGQPFWSCGLSRDGSRLAIALDNSIRIFTFRPAGGAEIHNIIAPGRNQFGNVSWSADDKGLYVTSSATGRTEILYMELDGRTSRLWELPGDFNTVLLPSPDGRHLAFDRRSSGNNAWMMEKF